MALIKQLTQKRGQLKAKLTRFQTFLQSCDEEDETTARELQERYVGIETVASRFDEVQTELMNARIAADQPGEADKLVEDENESAQFEKAYFTARSQAQAKLLNLQPAAVRNNQSNEGNYPENRSRVKLPEINLPKFGGKWEKWIEFKDSFESAIHKKTYLTEIEKFHYLRGLLIDEAATVVSTLSTTTENYRVAWKLLKDKYDNKRLIIDSHLRQLLNIAEINKQSYTALNQLLIQVGSHTQALQVLGAPVEHWDMILTHVVTNKLDFYTRSEWEKLVAVKSNEEIPTLKEFLDFLTTRCQTLQMINKGKSAQEVNRSDREIALAATEQQACELCQGNHAIYRCGNFERLSSQDKWEEIRRLRLCANCLRKGHMSKQCTRGGCKICSRHHNTILHQNRKEFNSQESSNKQETSEKQNQPLVAYSSEEASTSQTTKHTTNGNKNQDETKAVAHCAQGLKSRVILSTAQVYVNDKDNKPIKCRALLDPGSQLNLITSELAQKLKLPCKKVDAPLSGVSQSRIRVQGSVAVTLESRTSGFTATQDYLVLSKITERLPQLQMNTSMFKIPDNIQLADPDFNIPGEIDLLIGAGLFWKLLCLGQISQTKGQPILQKTLLGWIVGGEQVIRNPTKAVNVCNLSITSHLEEQIERFWKIEELTKKEQLTTEEIYCEDHFLANYTRNQDGRFNVKLPQNTEVELGNSEKEATKRMYSLDRRLKRDTNLRKEYTKFLDEYEELGHMTKIYSPNIPESEEVYYLLHHPVIREKSATTKLRVVFDGSAKTSLGTSLNERLLAGPNLQQEIINIMLRFRMYTYVMTADIAQMFKQIEVHEGDRNLQRILWKKETEDNLQCYVLNTITYGTTCAPYLAMRCLKQLAIEDGEKYPQAAEALKKDFYMDDVLTGSNSIEEAIELRKQLSLLLSCGKFELRKWRANDTRVLEHLSEESKTEKLLVVDKQEAIKTLGLLWNSAKDTFQYDIRLKEITKVTKRTILSAISQIYDPMGLLGPALMQAKIFMQELWSLKLEWDESVPQAIYTNWVDYYCSLEKINELKIPRDVNPGNAAMTIPLHGYGDASERGYGACLYALSQNHQGGANCLLICSKSRVAPLKKMTLPRLERSAALLLARLLDIVLAALGKEKIKDITLWSDSTIVLHWLRTPPNQLKTFVANRVAEIQESTIGCNWRHVPSQDNPADVLSRGAKAEQLEANKLWWHGPRWLPFPDEWPKSKIEPEGEVPEKRVTLMLVKANSTLERLQRFSSFLKLERVIAYCHRFIENVNGKSRSGPLTVEEIRRANLSIIRMVQQQEFYEEYQDLKENKELKLKNKLNMLRPFIDHEGLIRVGGRIRHASISEARKHPILLPSKHFVTELIMRNMHLSLKHCGPEHLLNAVREIYWPISGRREARKVTRRCIPCFRFRPKPCETLMADLPESRVKEFTRPFETTGVDYAGPLQVRESKRRGRIPITKAYIAVFTCFATKAVHLELVTDLTTEAFLAALRRFVARRGLRRILYSDNGTNFVGAARELREVYELLSQNEEEIATRLSTQKITWKFIPPRAPHFGGLWEAAVKATKRHLYIIMQKLTYTFEEYYTLLAEIKAILNSRPLTPLSSDPHDLTPLTPSHFLIGVAPVEPITADYTEVRDNHLSRWQHIQKLKQNFWQRWKREYLSQLQSRTKWITSKENLKLDTLVLVIDDNTAPLNWTLGRVVQVHPGSDGVVRVATVKTEAGTFKRPVRKLCALPLDN